MKNNKLFAMALSVALTSASAVNMYSSAAMISDKDSDNYKNKIENLNAKWTSAEDLTATLSDVLKCGNNALISNVKNAWYKGNDSEFAVYMIEQAVDDSYNFTVELADNDAEQFIKTFKEKVGFTDKMEYFTEVYNNRLLVSCVFSTDNHEFNYMISEKAYSVLNEMTSVIDFSAGFDRSSFEELNMNCYVSIYENMKKSEYDSVYDLVDHEMLMEKYGATYDKATRKIEFPSEISEKEKLECYKYFTVNFDGVISSEYALKGIQISSFDFKDIDISYLENDANCDGETNMADAVIIMQSLANPNKYGINGTHETHITSQGEFNGDMDGNGLTNADALEIQKMLLKIS